jgi:putative peptide maturation system protein
MRIAATVNGETITLQEALTAAKWREQLEFLQNTVEDVLIRQEAVRRGIDVSEEELQQAADHFRSEHHLLEIKSTQRWLADRSLDMDEWTTMLEQEIRKHKVLEAVTEGRVELRFAEHRLALESASLSQIVVREEGVACELRAQIVEEGADFHALARQLSQDSATRPAGGFTGSVPRKSLPAAVEAAVFGAKAGDIVGPLKVDRCWHLLKIEALHPAVLDETTRQTLKTALFEEWLNARRREAEIQTPLLEWE